MNETNTGEGAATYQAVRIGDVADWRLLAVISPHGMGAWLKHVDPVRPLATLFERRWNAEGESLLQNIENLVYDHPQVLDDFTTDIALVANNSLWVPTELVADDDEEAARLYNRVYSADEGDVMSVAVDDATCLFSLAPGLRAFLQRTFPGARIHTQQSLMVRRLRERSADMPRVYLDIRQYGADGGEVDFVAFDRERLLMCATHRWRHPDDLRYHLFNIMSVFGLDPAKTQVSVSGPSKLKTELVQELRRNVAYVMMTMVPAPGFKADLPLAASLLLRK